MAIINELNRDGKVGAKLHENNSETIKYPKNDNATQGPSNPLARTHLTNDDHSLI